MLIKLSDTLAIPAEEFAIQGNAFLGIRDSGKSYAATWMAERLLDAGIPFVAYDPIGVWRGLKYGRDGKPGYPVVVVGAKSPDIPLVPEKEYVERVTRAAMQQNVPIVFDMFDVHLSKSDIRKTVLASGNVLLYENEHQGVRHVFVEEAAEYVPQIVRDDSVYSMFDKLGRLGGNEGLGYSIINQRAADVNKSILELCNTLFLFKQTGSNTITALQKWMKVVGSDNAQELAASLPRLEAGNCLVWLPGQTLPQRIKIPEKTTMHPNRREPGLLKKAIPTDVFEFVSAMKQSIEEQAKTIIAIPEPPTKRKPSAENQVEAIKRDPVELPDTRLLELESTKNRLELSLVATKKELQDVLVKIKNRDAVIANLRDRLRPEYDSLKALFADLDAARPVGTGDAGKFDIWRSKLNSGEVEMLDLFLQRPDWTKVQLDVAMAKNRETVRLYVNKLTRIGLVVKVANGVWKLNDKL